MRRGRREGETRDLAVLRREFHHGPSTQQATVCRQGRHMHLHCFLLVQNNAENILGLGPMLALLFLPAHCLIDGEGIGGVPVVEPVAGGAHNHRPVVNCIAATGGKRAAAGSSQQQVSGQEQAQPPGRSHTATSLPAASRGGSGGGVTVMRWAIGDGVCTLLFP